MHGTEPSPEVQREILLSQIKADVEALKSLKTDADFQNYDEYQKADQLVSRLEVTKAEGKPGMVILDINSSKYGLDNTFECTVEDAAVILQAMRKGHAGEPPKPTLLKRALNAALPKMERPDYSDPFEDKTLRKARELRAEVDLKEGGRDLRKIFEPQERVVRKIVEKYVKQEKVA